MRTNGLTAIIYQQPLVYDSLIIMRLFVEWLAHVHMDGSNWAIAQGVKAMSISTYDGFNPVVQATRQEMLHMVPKRMP